MRLKILLTGKDKFQQMPDAELLINRGCLVYRCSEEAVNEMIDEVHPDVLIINPLDEVQEGDNLYQRMVNNIKYARLPLIYTLVEDDVYLVNCKRTAVKSKRNFIVDNIIDGIKTALGNTQRDISHYNLGLAS